MDEISIRRVRLLANGTNRRLILALGAGPSYPRELAVRLGISEDHAQRRLRELQSAGLVRGRWNHVGKTVKLYEISARTFMIDVGADDGREARSATDVGRSG